MFSSKKNSDAGTPTAEEDIKVVLVGDTQCGKTSLVQRFVSDAFMEVRIPIAGCNNIIFCFEIGRWLHRERLFHNITVKWFWKPLLRPL